MQGKNEGEIHTTVKKKKKNLRKVGFYDLIKNQTYLNVPTILYFHERGAQLTGPVHDTSKKVGVFMELYLNQHIKFNEWIEQKWE